MRELTSGFCLRFPVCCTRTPSMSSTTTPLGASERQHCQCLCSPLRPRGRAGVFRRREGPASQSLPGTPSSSFSRLSVGYVRGVSTSGGFAAAGPVLWYGSASPTSLPSSSLLPASMRGGYVFQGRRTCFPSAFDVVYGDRIQYVLTSVYMFRGKPIIQGVRTCFLGAFDTEFGHRNSYVFLTVSPMHRDPVNRGARTSFPGRD